MQIVFGIMSAVHSAAAVEQLARALAPFQVAVHHDFEQTPDFSIDADNVSFVPAPKRTGWAVWGFTEGILHLLDYCLQHHDADYFQLLSPTCLPVRPVSEFAEHVKRSRCDVHVGRALILRDPDLLMNFGYRAFCPHNSIPYKVLQSLRKMYFGKDATRREVANLQTQVRSAAHGLSPLQHASRVATLLARRGWLGSHPFTVGGMEPVAGGTWFGCNRSAGLYLVNRTKDPAIRRYFSTMRIADEMMFSTLFHNSPFDVGEPDHYVHTFNEHNPRWITPQDLPAIEASGRYFARKFHDDPADEARLRVLQRIGGSPGAQPAPRENTQPVTPPRLITH